MAYRIAVFDMDGTVLSTLTDIADSLNYALEKNNMPVRTIDEVRSFVGNGVRRLINRSVPPSTDDAVKEKVIFDYSSHYAVHCDDHTEPYDGILSLIDELRSADIKIAIVSNKSDCDVKTLCEKHFFGRVDCAVGLKEGNRPKPYTDSVDDVLSILNIDRSDAVYIGDSEVDIETARNSGMDCISVDWGFRGRDFLIQNGAVQIASTSSELKNYILKEDTV